MSAHDAAQEATWVQEAADGDHRAFESLARAYQGELLGFFHPRTGSRHDAEDLVQTTLVKAYRNLHRYNPRWAVRTWIFAIARRSLIDHYRRQAPAHRRPTSLEDAPEPVETGAPDTALDVREQAAALWTEASRALPEAQATALWLHYREDLSVKEVARAMGRTSVDVKVLLHRGRKKLAARWGGTPCPHHPERASWMQARWEQSPC